MKSLIVYYSRTGNNEKVAKQLQTILGSDIERINEHVNRQGIWGFITGGRDAATKRIVGIEQIKNNPKNYELVVAVAPLWVGVVPPAMRAYIAENRDKINKLAFVSVSGSGAKNKDALPDLEKVAGKKLVASFMIEQKEIGLASKLNEFAEKLE